MDKERHLIDAYDVIETPHTNSTRTTGLYNDKDWDDDWEEDDWDDDDFSKQREVITQLIAEINRFYSEQGKDNEPAKEPEKQPVGHGDGGQPLRPSPQDRVRWIRGFDPRAAACPVCSP